MAATAKSSSSSSSNVQRNFGGGSEGGQEDIESIRKQISDHAEAIYQTWKARGLPPTEILNCHTDSSAFNKTLSPTDPNKVAELLAQAPDFSNNNLEKLVNSFVSEDKARIAAQRRQNSPTSGGSIAHVLQKFERSSSEPPPANKPNYVRQSSTPPSTSSSNGLNKNVPDVLKDTIDKGLPSNKQQKPQTPAKPEHLLNHVPSWPLKNRSVVNSTTSSNSSNNGSSSIENTSSSSSSSPNSFSSANGSAPSEKSDMVKKQVTSNNVNSGNSKKLKAPSSAAGSGGGGGGKNTNQLLDEVTREEERLINALKTGIVLNNDPVPLPEVITSTLNDSKDHHHRTTTTTIMSKSDVSSENGGTGNQSNKLFNGVPAKPNHTPMFNVQAAVARDGEKPFTINKVATTRIPLRPQLRELEESKNFQAKSTPQPVRPFLSRGSVAERVLIFEKAPPERVPTERRASLKEVVAKISKPLAVSTVF